MVSLHISSPTGARSELPVLCTATAGPGMLGQCGCVCTCQSKLAEEVHVMQAFGFFANSFPALLLL